MNDERPLILCVDDEKRVVDGLALNLRKHYRTVTALSGSDALAVMSAYTQVAVIVSDMRMPGMDGAMLLAKVRELYPETTRVLLTGDASRDAVVSAVNDGQIFRFLTKPCAPGQLVDTINAAVAHHQLLTAERVLLRETLLGCIRSLVDVLALTNPVAYGQSSRLRGQVVAFAEHLKWDPANWQLEAAAMLSQIGYLSLPPELVAKIYDGEELTPDEQIFVGGVTEVAARLLGRIPRLEPVVEILNAVRAPPHKLKALAKTPVGDAAQILSLVSDFDALISQKHSPETALQVLQSRADRYDGALVREFARHLGAAHGRAVVVEIPLRSARPGMIILQDIRTDLGMLLVARGFEVTDRFIEKIKHFDPEMLALPVQMRVPPEETTAISASECSSSIASL